jgi:prevent-host-death family protein
MTRVTVEDAKRRLTDLVREAAVEEIVLTENGQPIARLVPFAPSRRVPGSAEHLPHYMAEDFDALPEGFEEYVP